MLRAITRQQVLEIVEGSYFGSENYLVQFGESGSHFLFSVRFIADNSFEFRAELLTGNHFKTKEAPGMRFLAAEEFRFEGFDIILHRLPRWLDRVHQEVIAANPFSREVLELRAQLDSRLAALGEELSGFFTISEANDLMDRLSVFEQRLQELAGDNEELKVAVETLSRTVTDLKEAALGVNRGTWFRMAGGRLLGSLKTLAKSKEAREFALEAAKKFLLEGPK